MRIVFMGTPDFAASSLGAILAEGRHEVAAVFTQPDKPVGRSQKLTASPVKELALSHDIAVYQPQRIKSNESVALLQELRPELMVVVAYGQILNEAVLSIPRFGCVNVHGSLLPKYRGAGPVQWSIIRGETQTGVTTMYMDQGVDTGDMIFKKALAIEEEDDASTLHDKLAVLGAELLLETLGAIEKGGAPREKQDDGAATYAPMLSKECAGIDFTKTAREVFNQIRGMAPWPVARTLAAGKELKVYRAALVPGGGKPGEVLDDKRLIVGCGQGAVELLELQPAGKKKMCGADFLRGRGVQKGDVLTMPTAGV